MLATLESKMGFEKPYVRENFRLKPIKKFNIENGLYKIIDRLQKINGDNSEIVSHPINSVTDLLERLTPAVPPELTTSPEEVYAHIIGVHFSPNTMGWYGVPCYDMGLLKHRGMSAEPVENAAYRLLGSDKQELERLFGEERVKNISLTEYRIKMVKTLRYMEQEGLVKVNWRYVRGIFQYADAIKFDPDEDTISPNFSVEMAWRQLKHGLIFRERKNDKNFKKFRRVQTLKNNP